MERVWMKNAWNIFGEREWEKERKRELKEKKKKRQKKFIPLSPFFPHAYFIATLRDQFIN